MEKLQRKYAEVLLKTCLKIEECQPLFITYDIERRDFVRIVAEIAYELGVKDIYLEANDPLIKHDSLKYLNIEDLKKSSLWNKDIWNVYAKKNAAFLMLASQTPNLMKDIDEKKLNDIAMYALKTKKDYNDLRAKSKLAWCIAAVPTLDWAKEVYPDALEPLNKLWQAIFRICSINTDNPEKEVLNKIKKNERIAGKLNEYNFKTLHYQNKLGTDFTIELPEGHVWATGSEKLTSGKDVLVNFPSLEVFTSPKYDTAEGIVYSSKPLCYQDVLIDEFSLTFEKGKVVKVGAKKGLKTLKTLVSSCKNSDYLGEVALVPFNSEISNEKTIFYETLYDENASCHLALGDSFPECLKNGVKMSKEELYKKGLNHCDNHVDFMVGTKDLKITGTTYDDKEVIIFENGNFAKEFIN